MSVTNLLKEALLDGNWDKVQQAYSLLGGESFIPQQETPPKKPRGRPKKVKVGDLVVTTGGEVGKLIPAPNIDDDFTVVRTARPQNGQNPKYATPQPFQPPKGPNQFDPRTQADDNDSLYNRVNDKVAPVPRKRAPTVTHRPAYCKDCDKTVEAPVLSSLHLELGRCEYATVGKTDKCPYSSQCGG